MPKWLKRILGMDSTAEMEESMSAQNLRETLEEELASEPGIGSLERAFELLDAGDLDGTLLEMELKMLRFLESSEDPADPTRKVA